MTKATTASSTTSREVNGSAMAALLAGGIGAFAMGAVVLLNEAGIFAAPSLYAPAGGVSGRTTLATIVWLMAWAVLHNRWKARAIAPGAPQYFASGARYSACAIQTRAPSASVPGTAAPCAAHR